MGRKMDRLDGAGSGSPTPAEGAGGSKSTNYRYQIRPILNFKQSLAPHLNRSVTLPPNRPHFCITDRNAGFCITGLLGRESDLWLQTYL